MNGPLIELLQLELPAPAHEEHFLKRNQTIYDIIMAMMAAHKMHRAQYALIADFFWDTDLRTTAEKIFNFCKKNIAYRIEDAGHQTVRTPAVLLHDQHGDSKHYAMFIAGIFDALRHNHKEVKQVVYRFVSDLPSREVHHVFIVINRTIFIDPALPDFNERRRWSKQINYEIHKTTPAGDPGPGDPGTCAQ